ncbi:MAG: shikimate dehydrogenase [Caulobacteraceae bacterium]|nr:shikimate dehydrogenase [Caulobacteraceae bacterium]
MSARITGATCIAGVVGSPVRHSLSPLIHNAWLAAAGIDGVYVAFPAEPGGFKALVDGFRGGVVAGLNVTLPFKEEALALADRASARALAAGAANLLLFEADGAVRADNTDGLGLLAALALQAPGYDIAQRPVVVFGAGGAARGAAAALLDAGSPQVRLVNRTRARAEAIAEALGERIEVFDWGASREALAGAGAVVNATRLGLEGGEPLAVSLDGLHHGAVVMDMVYKPLRTAFLARAEAQGFRAVDGLAMLIGQAEPSFNAFFGADPPVGVDVRGLALQALGVAA